VLEGSTLGGQHIVQMLAAKPILRQRKDVMRFFGGYENDTMQMWEIFKDHIDTTIKEKDVGEVVPAAIDTFVLLEKWASNKDNDRDN
jgi:heme oxygenase